MLRESKDDILTILEVLTHDPLYNWSMTPEKAFKIQGRHSVQSRDSRDGYEISHIHTVLVFAVLWLSWKFKVGFPIKFSAVIFTTSLNRPPVRQGA